ncbi:amidohydrolase family protein [Psychromonas arctica]|uniref:amidohydrolase family protein n=1 Tax=Psychromonas arctica TaxID=168275 RepID=UPI002FCF925B
MAIDTIIINCLLEGKKELSCVFIEQGRFVKFLDQKELLPSQLQDVEMIDAKGQLMLPPLVETHVHLDKACIFSRCELHKGTLSEAIEQTANAKANFDYEDVYIRGKKVIEKAIKQGTSYMRTHVEIDPVIGLTGFRAIQQLKQDYAWGITLSLCVFPQEGLHNNEGTHELLEQALQSGADLLGGCPYTDSLPEKQIETLFELANKYDVDLDFHLDFDLDSNHMLLPHVIEMTKKYNYKHRVTVGHVTKLSTIPMDKLAVIAQEMAIAGVHLTALPSTDLFLMGREFDHNIPRGVAPLMPLTKAGVNCSISSNNIENPFTPYGDCSQVRQANLFANIAQLATKKELVQCLDWVSSDSALLMRMDDYGIAVNHSADAIFFPVRERAEIIATIQPPSFGIKSGKITFSRDDTHLYPPK